MTKRNFSSTHAHSITLIRELCTHIHTVSELVELVALSEPIRCASSSRGLRATARASDVFRWSASALHRVVWAPGLACGRAGSSPSTACCALPPAMVSRPTVSTCTTSVAHLCKWARAAAASGRPGSLPLGHAARAQFGGHAGLVEFIRCAVSSRSTFARGWLSMELVKRARSACGRGRASSRCCLARVRLAASL